MEGAPISPFHGHYATAAARGCLAASLAWGVSVTSAMRCRPESCDLKGRPPPPAALENLMRIQGHLGGGEPIVPARERAKSLHQWRSVPWNGSQTAALSHVPDS